MRKTEEGPGWRWRVLPGVCWGVRSVLQVEGRQNWIPENKGAGWRFRTVGTSAQHTKKQDLFVEYRGYAQKQLQARRIILRRLAKSKPGAKLRQCTCDILLENRFRSVKAKKRSRWSDRKHGERPSD